MKVLVACQRCKRQYVVTGKTPGTRFYCHCGSQITVPSPQSHDADVVRCSSCGGPRQEGSDICCFCGAEFTLHEKDLNTVCSACFARVSDHARFCHHCGTPITAEEIAESETTYNCPSCKPTRHLVSRRLGKSKFAAFECQNCAGLWIDLRTLDLIVNVEAHQTSHVGVSFPQHEPLEHQPYRPCAVCGELMPRHNFGLGQSGVIVDVCGYHGIWFEAEEFARIIAWIRSGGAQAARQELSRLVGSEEHATKKEQPMIRPKVASNAPHLRDPLAKSLLVRICDVICNVIDLFTESSA